MKVRHVLAASLALAAPAVAAPHPPATDARQPKQLDVVLGCRSITGATERLACFDRSVDALQSATAKHDIVVVDREVVRKTRRSLFGFNLPGGTIFDPDNRKSGEPAEEEREINATIRSARMGADGYWVVVLEDGAVWHQTDGTLALAPKPGATVIIRRATLGSYFMRIGSQPGVKARREG
ncbi:MAG TPA: hypothetical protein VKQ27_04825 [Acetobacteraceae bacterium]|nr:hypothetical protein [Acetobacteraceae bacterium]